MEIKRNEELRKEEGEMEVKKDEEMRKEEGENGGKKRWRDEQRIRDERGKMNI